MSEGLNSVMLLGALGNDPELRFTQGGNAVLNIRLATTERYKDSSGEWKERTEWHSVTVWGKRAEALSKILSKGSSIFVQGSLRTTSYDATDGTKRYRTEINANNVILTGSRGRGAETGDDAGAPPQRGAGQRSGGSSGGGYGGSGGGRTAGRNQSPPPDDFGGGDPDGDIPFASSSMSNDLRRSGL